MAAPIYAPGTIVKKQRRGARNIQHHGRILSHFTTQDKLGRKQGWYRCHVIETGVERDWPASHCLVVQAAPAAT
jgi:hypothetical protein